ncbi:MAG: transglutaminase domain-containing protein [Anaerolineaceae bacterium]|nr:transglutaminase domain-containing protein [Anaerolineaceae bacterium]
MSDFINLLKNRNQRFSFSLNRVSNINEWIEYELLKHPSVLASIANFSYQAIKTTDYKTIIHFSASYVESYKRFPVFLAKDAFELTTAIATALRLHLETTIITVDNRSGFIPRGDKFSLIKSCSEFVGEELQSHQHHTSQTTFHSFFDGRLAFYKIETSYFDSAKEINDLSCILAEQASIIRRNCHDDKTAILKSIMKWFKENVGYLKTNNTSDYSAVGLFKKKTAVCQGIAAYAYLLLCFCGIETRYVSGKGFGRNGWEPHGWNMVFIQNAWKHIDFTFELEKISFSLFKTINKFKRDHHWDETRYSDSQSNMIANAKRTLRHSILIMLPGESYYSINGCMIDMSGLHNTCVVHNGIVYISLLDVIALFGGCYCLKVNSLYIYIGTNSFIIPLSQLAIINNTWYTNAINLKMLNLSVRLDETMIVIENKNW